MRLDGAAEDGPSAPGRGRALAAGGPGVRWGVAGVAACAEWMQM